MIDVKVKTVGVEVPRLQTEGAAGFDLAAAEEVIIRPGETRLIRTGLYMEIPKGYEGQIRNRSGLCANTDLIVKNSPGTIDSDYRGEIQVIIMNISDSRSRHNSFISLKSVKGMTVELSDDYIREHMIFGETYIIRPGDRIAQMIFSKVAEIDLVRVDEIGDTERGTGGFGHTGV